MMNRAERREQARTAPAPLPKNGTARRYQDLALAELDAGPVQETEDSRRDFFVALLSDWRGARQAQAEYKSAYRRVQELIIRGRKGLELGAIREKYAQLVEEQELTEAQMLSLLRECEGQMQSDLLRGSHVFVPRGLTLAVPSELRERLEAQLVPAPELAEVKE